MDKVYCHWLKKNDGGALCVRSALELRGLIKGKKIIIIKK